jgi:hypothetical protein
VRRSYVLLLIAVGLIVFVGVSLLLARVFNANGAEQSAITSLVQAEARGDATAMIAQIDGCTASAACRARVVSDAAQLRRPGALSVLQLQPSTNFSLGGHVGIARVAWKTPASLPIVQCVRVRRAGDAISGLHVQLLELSLRIQSDADCPARF